MLMYVVLKMNQCSLRGLSHLATLFLLSEKSKGQVHCLMPEGILMRHRLFLCLLNEKAFFLGKLLH